MRYYRIGEHYFPNEFIPYILLKNFSGRLAQLYCGYECCTIRILVFSGAGFSRP